MPNSNNLKFNISIDIPKDFRDLKISLWEKFKYKLRKRKYRKLSKAIIEAINKYRIADLTITQEELCAGLSTLSGNADNEDISIKDLYKILKQTGESPDEK